MDWTTGNHRSLCGQANAVVLNKMPETVVKCPQCKKPLRKWKSKNKYICKGEKCLRCNEKEIDNANGNNRYNCFQCDFDLCRNCVNEM